MIDLLIIDNYDSFTYNLVAYCQELGANTIVVNNDEITIEDVHKINSDKILISPGPGRPKDAGISLSLIDTFYKITPILGVCLGHQCIGHYFGAKIIHAKELIHGKTSAIRHNKNNLLFKHIPKKFNATRYNSLVIDNNDFPEELNITAVDSNDEIMAVEHKEYSLYGVQFHPESVLSEHGHAILSNFIQAPF